MLEFAIVLVVDQTLEVSYNIHYSNFDKFINSFHENKINKNYITLTNKFFNDYNGNNIPWHDYVKY